MSDSQPTCQEFLDWIDARVAKHDLPRPTCANWKAACNSLLPLAGADWQQQPVNDLDLEQLKAKARNQGSAKWDTVCDYARRIQTGREQFTLYLADPIKWRAPSKVVNMRGEPKKSKALPEPAEPLQSKGARASYAFPHGDMILQMHPGYGDVVVPKKSAPLLHLAIDSSIPDVTEIENQGTASKSAAQ